MSRGELLKKYLAVKAHVDFVAPAANKHREDIGVDVDLTKAWTEEMRKEMDRDRRRGQVRETS